MNGAIEDQPPSMPVGLNQDVVVATICDAIAGDASDLPSAALGP